MKTRYQLTLSALLAALLITLNVAALGAMPLKPGNELAKRVYTAPVKPNSGVKAHSDEWTDAYLDKHAATSFAINAGTEIETPIRGGMAGQTANAKPIAPKLGIAPHSEAWNAFYFDRNVNTQLPNVRNIPAVSWDGKHAGGAIGKNLNRWDLLP